MKTSRFIALVAATLLAITPYALCQNRQQSTYYKLQKAMEILEEENDIDKALDLVKEQLKETPDNVEALMLGMKLHKDRSEYADALDLLDHAIKVNKPKKSSLDISTMLWWKAVIYEEMGEKVQAEELYRQAVSASRKEKNENLGKLLSSYAQLLWEMDRYDEADVQYNAILKENPNDQHAMVGLARNLIERGDYSGAAALCEKARKFDESYSGTYEYAAEAYHKMGEHKKAVDNAIRWLELDEESFDYNSMDIFTAAKSYSVAKVKEKMQTSDKKTALRILLITIYDECGDYENAIAQLDIFEQEYGRDVDIFLERGRYYDELGLTGKAISEFKSALELDDAPYNRSTLADCYRGAGMYAEAIELYTRYIEERPSNPYGYYTRGWSYELSGDKDKALEDYNTGIDIDDSYPYTRLMRGELLLLERGDSAAAKADFERVLQLDTVVRDGSCRQYALHFLGKDDEAQEWMEKIIAAEPDDNGHWYDQACLFCRMGRPDDAVTALEKCLEMGWCDFAHIEHDDDLDPIRSRQDFIDLITKYKEKLAERTEKLREKVAAEPEPLITEIPISRHSGGTFEIPCKVNGLDLNMIFDTGASDVTISSVEANFMLKNDYLKKDDLKGKKYYQVANGDIQEGTVITLREVKVGDAVLKNVDASVVKSQKAPLLLGQSVMERFGIITIDNINSKLIIKQ